MIPAADVQRVWYACHSRLQCYSICMASCKVPLIIVRFSMKTSQQILVHAVRTRTVLMAYFKYPPTEFTESWYNGKLLQIIQDLIGCPPHLEYGTLQWKSHYIVELISIEEGHLFPLPVCQLVKLIQLLDCCSQHGKVIQFCYVLLTANFFLVYLLFLCIVAQRVADAVCPTYFLSIVGADYIQYLLCLLHVTFHAFVNLWYCQVLIVFYNHAILLNVRSQK